jgi:hypothetical protein
MSLKKKIKINGEEISDFAKKVGARYEIRMKLDKSFSDYLTQVNIPLQFPAEKEFHSNFMKILG